MNDEMKTWPTSVRMAVRKIDGADRLVFAGQVWKEMDPPFCIHGEKLRWFCDECASLIKTTRPRRAGNR